MFPMDVIIYHNPDCGTSRNTLAMIRNAGIEPHVIEYLKTPPTRTMLKSLIDRMGVPIRAVIREKGTPYHDLGLDNPTLSDDKLLDAILLQSEILALRANPNRSATGIVVEAQLDAARGPAAHEGVEAIAPSRFARVASLSRARPFFAGWTLTSPPSATVKVASLGSRLNSPAILSTADWAACSS